MKSKKKSVKKGSKKTVKRSPRKASKPAAEKVQEPKKPSLLERIKSLFISKQAVEATPLSQLQRMALEKAVKVLENVPDSASGYGAVRVLESGRAVTKTFKTAGEAREILRKIRSGELKMA